MVKLRLICLLKSLGLNLDSIKAILVSENQNRVLTLLLDEQIKQLSDDISEKRKQLEAVKVVKESICIDIAIPVNSISDIENIMENKKGLRKVHGVLIGGALPTTLIWWGTIAAWIMHDMWIPFAVYTPIHLVICLLLVRFLHSRTEYICPECNKVFRPPFKKFIFTSGNKTRLLTCTECGYKGLCVEVYAK